MRGLFSDGGNMTRISPWAETLAEFLRREPGVEAVRLDPEARKVRVATLGQVDVEALRARLEETLSALEGDLLTAAGGGAAPAGFTLTRDGGVVQLSGPACETAPKLWRWKEYEWPEVADEEHDHDEDWRELAAYAGVCGVFGLAGWGVKAAGVGPAWLGPVLGGVALVAGGWDAAKDSWENLRKAKLDIHFLMLAVAVGATFIGAWSEAVLLLFLFSASGAMEAYADERTHREVDALLKAAPKQATVVDRDGREKVVAVEEIGIGDLVRVKPGEAFCADGVVESGESGADESALTGEAVPVEKSRGDQVFSGTINVGGTLDWRVARLPSESTLQKIIRLIHGAQRLRAPSQRFTDKFGTGYTYAVLGVSAAMFLVWWLGAGLQPWRGTGTEPSAFYRAMTLLVVMSPCALVLSIPSAILAAIAWGPAMACCFAAGPRWRSWPRWA